MERLTKRLPNGMAYLAKVKDNEQEIEGTKNTLEYLLESWQRLAAYEDIGLTLERASELAAAEKDGRLVVMPAIKKNSTLYWVWADEVMPVICKGISHGNVGRDGKFCVYYNVITKKSRTFNQKYRGKSDVVTVEAGSKRLFSQNDLGKIIFHTRAEAKAALVQKENP